MLTALTFAIACVVGLLVTPVVRHYAHRLELLDMPGGRKVHQVPVPRLGGVAMTLAFAVGVGFAGLVASELGSAAFLRLSLAPAILSGVALLLVIGVIDDVRGVPALAKLGGQVAVALLAAIMGLRLERLVFPWGDVDLGPLSVPLTVAWVVGVMNAINLIDGLDGLASGVVLTVLGAFGLLAVIDGTDPIQPIIAATVGAAVGFLAYNLHPASIIMGDTGSMLLGFVVAAVGILLTQDSVRPVAPWVPIIALGVPLIDTAWAVVRRTARGEPFFVADRGHIHHQLLRRGLSQRDAMLTLTALSGALALIAVGIGQLD
jgi:UDP-GlcNAc:undecaprenyl-phosphate/decaprenyl-phosphate GlcNAc-1-phosphate transferase